MLRKIPEYIKASLYVRVLLYVSLATPIFFILVQWAFIGFQSIPPINYVRAGLVTLVLGVCTHFVLRRIKNIEGYLDELNTVQNQFLSMTSHDLKTPLSAMAMAIELLLQENLDKATKTKSLLLINRQTKRLIRMLEDLLLSQAAKQGRLELRIQPCPIKQVVEEAVDLLMPQFQAQGVSIGIDMEEMVCPCDQDRLQQILINLLSNAIKHTPTGGSITISGVSEKDVYRFCVSDTGQGIPKENIEHIFEPFRRLRATKGSYGLGLSIVRMLVEAHGGRAWAESWVGKGSKFYFTIKKGPCDLPATPK